jgi:hypothetical protein
MRYITFVVATREIITASGGPVESHIDNLPQGCDVADCNQFDLDGPLKNYMFVPGSASQNGSCMTGEVKRKPREEWDMQAENDYISMHARMKKFSRLNHSSINRVELAINFIDVLRKLPPGEYHVPADGRRMVLNVCKKECNPVSFSFDVGQGAHIGGAFPLGYMEVRFVVSADFDYIREISSKFIDDHGEAFNVFLDRVIYSSTIKLCLRACNSLIEAYRIAFDDAEARAIGIGDVLSSAMTITLNDGDRQNYSMGSPYRDKVTMDLIRDETPGAEDGCIEKMRNLLEHEAVPFIPSAIGLLKMAHFYGKYRECVVWSATIMATHVERMLRSSLPKDSVEYRKLKNDGKSVSGKEKRNGYFKVAFGITLAEYLDKIVSGYQAGNQSTYWNELPRLVEKVLGDRNMLLHRSKAISPREADDAFYTCMNFIYAMEGRVPYSVIYSRDFSLKMLDSML